jgi:hypothetical protein
MDDCHFGYIIKSLKQAMFLRSFENIIETNECLAVIGDEYHTINNIKNSIYFIS